MVDLGALDICVVAGTLARGGSEQQLYYKLKCLKARGARLRVLSLDRRGFWEDAIRVLDIPVIWVGRHKAKARRLASIVSALRRQPPDVIQSQHFFANVYVAAAARLVGARDIGALRGDLSSCLAKLGPFYGPLSLRAPRFIAANSERAIGEAIARGLPERNLLYLRNVLDTNYFSPNVEKRSVSSRLLFVGRLVPEKRVDRFLSVLSQVRRHLGDRVSGVVVGGAQGDETVQRELESRAARLGLLPEGVQFRGEVGDVRAEYRQADILVLTSDTEGCPNVVLEGMASGLPVVSTACGDVPAVVRPGVTGYVTEPMHEDRMVEAILTLLRNPGLRAEMGENARRLVEQEYALTRLPQNLQQLYGAVLAS